MAESPKLVELSLVDGCGTCAFCTRPSPREKGTGSAAGRATARACRRRAAGALLAIATGVVGIEAGTATPASALPAPSSEGWDGTRYWFKSNGQWRWTSHQSVYLQRTGGAAGTGTTGGATVPPKTTAPPKANTGSLEPALSYALAQLGKPYIWGGNGYLGYDCSGLVQQAYRRAGISLPRVASDQYGATTKISSSSLRRGDLIFWSSNGRQSGVHHVAVYLGGGRYVEAPRPGVNIRISSLSNGYAPNLFGRP
ncbi:C40 family peptidase [Streptomyces halstedii]|uniref:C40 family peptidase n=1 Tax=Streptomyces halstedii TaxID=1944 RepID=UPI00367394A8